MDGKIAGRVDGAPVHPVLGHQTAFQSGLDGHMALAGALDAMLDVAVAGAVQGKMAGHPQQIAQQGPAQRRAVHLAQPADKEGGRRRVMEGVARRLTGVGTQRIVIEQDVRALQADGV